MSGTKAGGQKTAAKNLAKDPDFYAKIGRKGGLTPTDKLKGFAANPELARVVGVRGGRISKRGKETFVKVIEVIPEERLNLFAKIRKFVGI